MPRSRCSSVNQPNCFDISSAITVPADTASPCNQTPYPCSVSIAWPKVCPKFKVARSPASRSSAETTRAFAAQDCSMVFINASSSSAQIEAMCCSNQVKKGSSQIKPYLITSASPADSSRGAKVRKVAMSIMTACG